MHTNKARTDQKGRQERYQWGDVREMCDERGHRSHEWCPGEKPSFLIASFALTSGRSDDVRFVVPRLPPHPPPARAPALSTQERSCAQYGSIRQSSEAVGHVEGARRGGTSRGHVKKWVPHADEHKQQKGWGQGGQGFQGVHESGRKRKEEGGQNDVRTNE